MENLTFRRKKRDNFEEKKNHIFGGNFKEKSIFWDNFGGKILLSEEKEQATLGANIFWRKKAGNILFSEVTFGKNQLSEQNKATGRKKIALSEIPASGKENKAIIFFFPRATSTHPQKLPSLSEGWPEELFFEEEWN